MSFEKIIGIAGENLDEGDAVMIRVDKDNFCLLYKATTEIVPE